MVLTAPYIYLAVWLYQVRLIAWEPHPQFGRLGLALGSAIVKKPFQLSLALYSNNASYID